MSTIKFNRQDRLDELQARIYLDTKIKLTKKELLELVFEIGIQNYYEILNKVKKNQKKEDDFIIEEILSLSEDFGPGSENLSVEIDKVVYGERNNEGNE